MRNATHSPITHATATLAISLAPAADAASLPDGMNVQLFPDGQFDARDGRPETIKGSKAKAWQLDAAIAAALIARANARETPFALTTNTTR